MQINAQNPRECVSCEFQLILFWDAMKVGILKITIHTTSDCSHAFIYHTIILDFARVLLCIT